jgi:hypothetical protein
MAEPKRKSLHFVGSSRKAIRDMPDVLREVFGGALLEAQYGRLPQGARPFGEGVLILTRLMAAAEHHRRTYAEQGDQEET